MSEAYIGDPVKRANKEARYRRIYQHLQKTGMVVERTARFFGTDRQTVKRAIKFCAQ
jgi:transcriptional regulator with GAF, ATPase, and Fis domain